MKRNRAEMEWSRVEAQGAGMRTLSGTVWNLTAVSACALILFGISSVSLSKGVPSGESSEFSERKGRLGGFSGYLEVRSHLEKERLAGLARFKKEKQLAERERRSVVEAYRREKSRQPQELVNGQRKTAYQEYVQERLKDYLKTERARREVVAERQVSQRKERKTMREVDEYALSELSPRVDWGRRGLFSNSTGFSLSPRFLPNDGSGGGTPPLMSNAPHNQLNSGPSSSSGTEMESSYPPASIQPIDQNWNSPYLPAPPSSVFEDEEPPF